MRNALISVYDKGNIVIFAQLLVQLGWNIISSGGTAKELQRFGIPVTDVADITGMGAVLGHRVVTLAPQIHGGLLATEDQREELEELGWPFIDMCCVDFYPLQEEIDNPEATEMSVIDKTDIGGPTMIRSAAKGRRITIIDPNDRMKVIDWLEYGEPEPDDFRRQLAAKAEGVVAEYCLASSKYHSR
jgi:phosphoribosylaminoimidazolecarboxamide formyltransferase/IMP cyclohydrolase